MPGIGCVRSNPIRSCEKESGNGHRVCADVQTSSAVSPAFFVLWHLHSLVNDDGRAYSIREEEE